MKCELRYERGASQYLKKEHFRQRNVCAKAGLQLMCLKNMHEAGVYGTGWATGRRIDKLREVNCADR